jgi:hypothetical protein
LKKIHSACLHSRKKLTWHHQAQGTGSIPSQGFPFGHCALFQERPEEQNQSTKDFFLSLNSAVWLYNDGFLEFTMDFSKSSSYSMMVI